MGDLAKVLSADRHRGRRRQLCLDLDHELPARRCTPGMRFLTPRGMAGLAGACRWRSAPSWPHPTGRCICLVGDGGFAHVWSELETSRRHSLPVTITVLNNQVLGYQKHAEDVLFGAHTNAVDFQPVDHAAIAAACGLRGCTGGEPRGLRRCIGGGRRGAGDDRHRRDRRSRSLPADFIVRGKATIESDIARTKRRITDLESMIAAKLVRPSG